MASDAAVIDSEINRIVTSAYPVALKTLHSLVCLHGIEILQIWTDSASLLNIRSLVSATLEAIEYWPYVVDLLNHLVKVPALRQEILSQSPRILSIFLERAAASRNVSDKWNTFCVSSLSEPLPSNTPLPESAQAWFCNLFEQASNQPCIEFVEPLYLLVDGACAQLLRILPVESMIKFREHLTTIMRSVKTVEDQYLSLCCFSILAKMRNARDEAWLDLGCKDDAHSTESWSAHPSDSSFVKPLDDIDKFFTGERATRMIHLLVLQVVYSCRTDRGPDQAFAFKHVKIAREVAQSIHIDTRYKWARNNTQIVRKLQEKMLRSTLDCDVQIQAFGFALLFSKVQDFSSAAIERYEHALHRLANSRINPREARAALADSLPSLAPFFQNKCWSEILRCVVVNTDAEGRTSNVTSICRVIIGQVQVMISEHASIRIGILRALSMNEIKNLIDSFCMNKAFSANNAEDPFQENLSLGNLESIKLGIDICSLIIKVSLYAQMDEVGMDISLAIRLIEKQKALSTFVRHNSVSESKRSHPSAIRISEINTIAPGFSRGWRQTLTAHIQAGEDHRQEAIVNYVAQICSDLEARCESVEQPLREEQDRVHQLQQEYNDLKVYTKSVECQLNDKAFEIESLLSSKEMLEQKRTLLESNLVATREEHEANIARLQQAKDNAECQLSESCQAFEAEKLRLRAAIACTQESSDSLLKELDAVKGDHQNLGNTLKRERESHGEQIAAVATELARETETNHSIRNQLVEAGERQVSLKEELAILTNRTERESACQKDRISELLGKNQQLHDGMVELQAKHERETDEISGSAASEKKRLEQELELARQENAEIQAAVKDKLNDRDAEIEDLREKFTEKSAECVEKTRALEELQELRIRLLTAMGLPDRDGAYLPAHRTSGPSQDSNAFDQVSQQQNNVGKSDRAPGTVQGTAGPAQAAKVTKASEWSFGETQALRPDRMRRSVQQSASSLTYAKASGALGVNRREAKSSGARFPLAEMSEQVVNQDLHGSLVEDVGHEDQSTSSADIQAVCHTPQQKAGSFDVATLSGLSSFRPSAIKNNFTTVPQTSSTCDENGEPRPVEDMDGTTLEL